MQKVVNYLVKDPNVRESQFIKDSKIDCLAVADKVIELIDK